MFRYFGGNIKSKEQNHELAKYCGKIKPEDGISIILMKQLITFLIYTEYLPNHLVQVCI